MKTFKEHLEMELREEALMEANLLKYNKEASLFLKKVSIAAGVTVSELSKSTLRFLMVPTNLLLVPFILATAWFPGTMLKLTEGVLRTILALFTMSTPWGELVDKLVLVFAGGAITAGGLTIALYGKKVGEKIIRAWDLLIKEKNIDPVKKADERSVKAFAKLTRKK